MCVCVRVCVCALVCVCAYVRACVCGRDGVIVFEGLRAGMRAFVRNGVCVFASSAAFYV